MDGTEEQIAREAEEQVAREIAREQEYADLLYARVDELITHVERNLDRIQGSQQASTHQNRSERDSFMALYEDRLALLRSVSRGVVFGRLDMDDAARHYIGRIGLFTPEREQPLVDWRAPAAAAFYRATSTERLDVRLRRHLISRGRTVVGLEDDVLDQSVLEDGEHDVVLQGEGRALAAVSGTRTGRMGDIVATIQAEQDRIIRSENRGVLVVQGGPGTGKTAVALHRAAYLLYTHRRRLEHTGVLIMAPTPGFLRYIERVLPSLGESGVVMMTPGEMFPGVETFSHDVDDVARLKGDAAMAEPLLRAVKQRQAVPEKDVRSRIDGTPLVLTRDMLRAARREARATHKPHNAARAVFVRAAMDRLVEAYERALVAQGSTIVPEDRPDLLSDLRHDPEVKRRLNLAWLPYTPQGFLRILFARPDRLRARRRAPSPVGSTCWCAPRTRPGRSRTCRRWTRWQSSSARTPPRPRRRPGTTPSDAGRTWSTPARSSRTSTPPASSGRRTSPIRSGRSATAAPLPSAPPPSAPGPTAMSWSTRRRSTPR
ncbi:hypothetical protein [Brachybacterium sp. GPGPB12]|uniref:HelD family protein n=1 Tax=Brachybacterium sp. GPGPB12 TaxID=3023517 RepID=UPI0031344DC8